MVKQLLCLAFSWKLGGYCMAGIDLDSRQWVRPVSNLDHGQLMPAHCSFSSIGTHHSFPKILDVVEIDFVRPMPVAGQPENWLLASRKWRKVRAASVDDVETAMSTVEKRSQILGNPYANVFQSKIRTGQQSLALVKPESLHWLVDIDRVRGKFKLTRGSRTVKYDLPLTDVEWKKKLLERVQGEFLHAEFAGDFETLLTISLGEPFEGKHWKLVAGVVTIPTL